MKNHRLLMRGAVFVLAGLVCAASYGQSKPKIVKAKPTPAKKDDTAQSAEPDKVLYERALKALKQTKYIESRLDFQTLINTYPDSEYLAKAKLGVADTFYKEGGTSSLTQAVDAYKSFIVFFPFLDEAAYAQMQVGMAHYKMMEKADRDNSQAEAAEDEFRTFLLKYPQSAYVPQAEQSLRNVQEVLADGQFGIAKFYYTKRPRDDRAAVARLMEVTNRYPLYSRSDEALWMMGDIYERAKLGQKNEDQRNVLSDVAAKCYDRIVQDYPTSPLVPGAKARLKAMNLPIPAPNPDALQRMKDQQLYLKQHRGLVAAKRPMEMIKSGPDVSLAARSGTPNLNPPDDVVSATEVLKPGSGGAGFTVVSAGSATASGDKAGTAETESVETETPAASGSAPVTGASVQILDAPNASGSVAASPVEPVESSPAPPAPPADARVDAAPPLATATPSVPEAEPATTAPAAAAESSSAPAAAPASTGAQTGTPAAKSAPAAGTSSSTSGAQAATDKSDPATESTSKKKKGLHKLIPF